MPPVLTLSCSPTDTLTSLSPFLSLAQLLSVSSCFFLIAPASRCWLFFLLSFLLSYLLVFILLTHVSFSQTILVFFCN
jgi:hypothetical protein